MDPELRFPESEYRERARRVRDEMARRSIDVLLVLSPPNLCYLTGFESVWYPSRAPVGCVLARSGDTVVFVDYERHASLVDATALADDAIFYRYETAIDTLVEAFRVRGWLDGTVGIEWHTTTPSGPLVQEIARRLGEAGATVVSGDWTVDRVRLVKSAAELERVERASAIVDAAFQAIPGFVRPGMSELEIAARIDLEMAERGGEEPAVRTMVSAGPAVWCRTHGAPSRRPVERGDVMYVDACGVVDRYHVDVCRTYAIGADSPRAREILDHTAQSVELVRRGVTVGDSLDVAVQIAEQHVHERFGSEHVWWIGGYALGIALPPSWVGHVYLSNDSYEAFSWEPGYLTNYENILFDRERQVTASYMETLLMTPNGIRILSQVPRGLTVIE